MGGLELCPGHERFVEPLDPFVAALDLSEVDRVPQDRQHGGLIHPGPLRNLRVA